MASRFHVSPMTFSVNETQIRLTVPMVFDHLPLEGSTTKQHKPQVSKNAAAKQQNKTLQKLPKKPPKGRAKWSKKHSTTRMN
ncbi:hypothetical protein LXL04_023461 [Taraxacum kok-saghyz]